MMASFPSSWIAKKAPPAPPSPSTTPTRPASSAAAKPHATFGARPPPSPTPTPTLTRHFSPASFDKSTSHGAHDSFIFSERSHAPPSPPRSRFGSLAFSCRDHSHFLPDMDDSILPNGPCGRAGCCGDDRHPSSFLDLDCPDDDDVEERGGVALGRAKPLPKQSPFTRLGQDAPPVFPSSWIVRETPTPVLLRDHTLPHAWERGRPPASVPSALSMPPIAAWNLPPARPAERVEPPPASARDEHPDAPADAAVRGPAHLGSGSASQTATASGFSPVPDEYMWELKEKPTRQEVIDRWLQSTSDMEPRKRVKRSHWFNNGSDASGDADEPHARLPVSDAYSDYSMSTQNTRRPA